METKPPLPAKTSSAAAIEVQTVEDAWNTRDLERVAAVARDRTHLQSLVNRRLFN
jgi:nuclear transport factor 2 (NTF2) superfamily protein